MQTLTIFSFGYFGWGNATKQLVQAVDAVEHSRGFKPPVFVDTRIRRSVRAIGFRERAFEQLLGHIRYHWMKDLGNRHIVTRSGPQIQIANPAAAEGLLELAASAARDNRRIIFFCSCQWPRLDGKVACHRTEIARLLLKAARRHSKKITVVEWPGGAPAHLEIDVSAPTLKSVRSGRMYVPVGLPKNLATFAGAPWGSTASFHCDGNTVHRIVGPARWQKDQWSVPVLSFFKDPATGLTEYKREAEKERKRFGAEPRNSSGR